MNNNLTTYYARRTNVFVWLAELLLLAAFVTRIVYACTAGGIGFWGAVVRIILPLAANLAISIQLLTRGERQFYVTRRPVVLFAVNFIALAISFSHLGLSRAMTALIVTICLFQAFLYWMTYSYRIRTQIPVFLAYAAFAAVYFVFRSFAGVTARYYTSQPFGAISDLCLLATVLAAILATRRMPEWKKGDPYRLRPGDRLDGRLLRSLEPMSRISPYIMVERNGASNMFQDAIEITAMERYIREKRRQGLKHFGITHVFIAAYVRGVALMPGLNRFLSGQKVYQRFGVDVNMTVKKSLSADSPDTCIKIKFDPADTADDVYRKFDETLRPVKESEELDSDFDVLAKILTMIPGVFFKFTVWLLKLLDYFGLLPEILTDLSPFHGSMFITALGSLGIEPVYHHLYDFGNVTQFCAFGCKRTEKTVADDGTVQTKKYVDCTWVVDERTVDGFYYAAACKKIKYLLQHPEKLDEPIVPLEDIY